MRFLFLLLLFSACKTIPQDRFEVSDNPSPPDYSDLFYWAAAPQKADQADLTPGNIFEDRQTDASVDVFFLHPTSYTKAKGNTSWNGDLLDEELNAKTDDGAIRFQASVFNGAGQIYAPRYRQAHIFSYYTKSENYDKVSAKKAFELAYADVKASFDYYLENWNNGRPIIIASHSQGTTHAKRLLQEYFDGKELQNRLVAAYLIGMPILESDFTHIRPCERDSETACFVSWRAYQRDYLPEWSDPEGKVVVTNPLSWTTDTSYVSADQNLGTVLYKFEKGIHPGLADAQKHKGHLWVTKPKFPGSALMRFKNYHVADYNLFYANIRKNAIDRVSAFTQSVRP